MQINPGSPAYSQPRMAEPARGERWAGFNGYAADILRSMREAGFSEEEIAARRLHRELGSRIDDNISRNNFIHQRLNSTGDRALGTSRLGPPTTEILTHTENILLSLIADAENGTDDLHREHWLRALNSHLSQTRGLLSANRHGGMLDIWA